MNLNDDQPTDDDRSLTTTPTDAVAPDVAPDAGESVVADGAESARAPMKRRQFRTAATKSKLSADEANRQGRVVRIAFEVMGRDTARAFLNEPNDDLGGRPLDVATASADGMQAVEAAISAQGGPKT